MIARLESGYLLLAGVVAALTGLGMIALPGAFYGSYGIDPAASIDLANELRSPGLWLALIGFIIARGALRPDMRRLSLAATAAAFYLSHAAARGLAIAADGPPGPGLITAMTSELLLGIAGALFWRRRHAEGHGLP